MSESASEAGAPARKKRTTTKKRATRRAAAKTTTGDAAVATSPRRGRPPGSRNKSTSVSTPAGALTRRVQALIKENEQLKSQVKELEASWRKLEKALGVNVSRAKRSVRKSAKRVTRNVGRTIENAIDRATA